MATKNNATKNDNSKNRHVLKKHEKQGVIFLYLTVLTAQPHWNHLFLYNYKHIWKLQAYHLYMSEKFSSGTINPKQTKKPKKPPKNQTNKHIKV